jgi:branched-chain amino acid transport system substrate-binding protein
MAVFGNSFRNGIELAIREANAEAGSAGPQIVVVYEDDAGKATAAVSAFQKLVAQNHVPAIVGGVMSSTAMPIAPLAIRNRVVLLSPTATTPALDQYKKFVYRIQPSDNYEGRVMAEFARRQLHIERIAILYVNNDWGKGLAEVFSNAFSADGGKIAASEAFALGATDCRAQIAKVKATGASDVYLLGYLKELSTVLRQMRELGLRAKILSAYSFHDPKLLNVAGPLAEGAIFTMPTYDPKSKEPAVVSFVSSYKKLYGSEPDMFAAHAYDCAKLLSAALSSGASGGDSIDRYLSTVRDYQGATGKITFHDGGVSKPLQMFTVRQGRFAPLSSWESGRQP